LKLTDAQKEVLELLVEHGPMQTSRTTHHRYVSGATARALIERKLVSVLWLAQAGQRDRVFHVQVTDAGREALFHPTNNPPRERTGAELVDEDGAVGDDPDA
jgi:DNA-binding MarR family transcriptional regulator